MTDAVYEATVSKLKRARPGSLPQPLEAAAVVKPVAAPEVTRVVYVCGLVDAPTRKGNPYENGGPSAARRHARQHVFSSLGARFGFAALVRVCQRTGDAVVRFAERDAADAAVAALHGTRRNDGTQVCADFLIDDATTASILADDPENADDASDAIAAAAARPVRPRCVVVENAFEAGELDVDVVSRCADDISVECSKFGPVLRSVCEPATARIVVRFVSSLSAAECVGAMRQRSYDDRVLRARFAAKDDALAGGAQAGPPEPHEPTTAQNAFWAVRPTYAARPPDPQDSPSPPLKSVRDRPPTPVPQKIALGTPPPTPPASPPRAARVAARGAVHALVAYAISSESDEDAA